MILLEQINKTNQNRNKMYMILLPEKVKQIFIFLLILLSNIQESVLLSF